MPGFTSITGDESIMFSDNASFDGTQRGGKMTTNGQLWIGSTISPHVRLGQLTSPDASITIGYVGPNITLQATGSLPYISLSPFIVGTDIHSGYPTIALGIAAAVAAGATASTPMNVYIKPKADGTPYTEDLTLEPGVNLIGFGQTPTIIGKITYTAAGLVSISGIKIQNSGDFGIQVSGANASVLVVINCNLQATASFISYTSSNAASSITLRLCIGQTTTTGIALLTMSSPGSMALFDCFFLNSGGSTTVSTVTAGEVDMFYCTLFCPFSITNAIFNISNSFINCEPIATTCITFNGTSNSISTHGQFSSLSSGLPNVVVNAGSLLTLSHYVMFCDTTNAITGAGTVRYALLSFVGGATTISVGTAVALPTLI